MRHCRHTRNIRFKIRERKGAVTFECINFIRIQCMVTIQFYFVRFNARVLMASREDTSQWQHRHWLLYQQAKKGHQNLVLKTIHLHIKRSPQFSPSENQPHFLWPQRDLGICFRKSVSHARQRHQLIPLQNNCHNYKCLHGCKSCTYAISWTCIERNIRPIWSHGVQSRQRQTRGLQLLPPSTTVSAYFFTAACRNDDVANFRCRRQISPSDTSKPFPASLDPGENAVPDFTNTSGASTRTLRATSGSAVTTARVPPPRITSAVSPWSRCNPSRNFKGSLSISNDTSTLGPGGNDVGRGGERDPVAFFLFSFC